ncbi:MAG: nucleotidyl transferase AbiEii/AbiGii toxin family protein [Nanoarchaeota archaeon]|nr:nucleotidyl transferase AbiEii/AbiGii toxin family protein [Nanoarchaeota archaeon]MBU4116183.1 nucleotidyl transferase AbiEii/AbiGii toxin family protein [Nanoarchaeota archaeon]
MKLPLISRIKKELHKNIAVAQDILIEETIKIIPSTVFHGGTCIWRCYSGKRFSEDLDFYFPKKIDLIEKLFQNLENKGFEIKKKKISDRSVYSELMYNRASVRLEATFQNIRGVLLDYEKVDGTLISIYGLAVEQLLNEKINAYLSRKKIRDIYDIFFLMRLVDNVSLIDKNIKKVINDCDIPEDVEDLKVLLLEGIVPKFNELKEYIKRKWENPNI